MSAGEISNAAYDRIGGVFHRALTGLTVEQLKEQPSGPESNPIGWLAWHLSRTQDKNYSELLGEEEAWTADGGHERFGLAPDRGSGNGDSLEQVCAFDPIDSDTLIAYFEVARTKSRRFLDAVTDDDLEKPSAAGVSAGRDDQDIHRPASPETSSSTRGRSPMCVGWLTGTAGTARSLPATKHRAQDGENKNMLTQEQNDRITRVGPGTPTGELHAALLAPHRRCRRAR